MDLPPNFKDSIIATLKERGAKASCEICDQNNWAVTDQPGSVIIEDKSGSWTVPPPRIPAAVLICNNCGNIRLHAMGVMGKMETDEEGGQKE